jgi:hypothetical protein
MMTTSCSAPVSTAATSFERVFVASVMSIVFMSNSKATHEAAATQGVAIVAAKCREARSTCARNASLGASIQWVARVAYRAAIHRDLIFG